MPYFLQDNDSREYHQYLDVKKSVALVKSWKQYDALCQCDDWNKEYFDGATGGYVATHSRHQFSKVTPTNPTPGLPNPYMSGGEAELNLAKSLAKQGKDVRLLPENGVGVGKPDMAFDGMTWDSKYIPVANDDSIRKAFKDARKADNVIFYSKEIGRINDVQRAIKREIGRFMAEGRQTTGLPNVYYATDEGIIMLWGNNK